jgi:hypothetical protein
VPAPAAALRMALCSRTSALMDDPVSNDGESSPRARSRAACPRDEVTISAASSSVRVWPVVVGFAVV